MLSSGNLYRQALKSSRALKESSVKPNHFHSKTCTSSTQPPRNLHLPSLSAFQLRRECNALYYSPPEWRRLYSKSATSSLRDQPQPQPRPQPDDEDSREQPRSKSTTSILQVIAWLPVFLFFTSHVYSIGQVHGASMSPTLNPKSPIAGERPSSSIVCLDRWSARIAHFKVGDIVTLISPLSPSQLLTKRILALPGDVIRVPTPNSAGDRQSFTRIKIPPGHAWVEGDSSSSERIGVGKSGRSEADKSRDSREFGPIPLGLVTSRITFVLWPLTRFGFPLPRPSSTAKTKSNSFSSASELDVIAPDLISKEVTKALDEAYFRVKESSSSTNSREDPDDEERSELIAFSSSNHNAQEATNPTKKVRIPIIQEDDGEEEVYEVDSILSPYTRDTNYVKGNSKATSGKLGWGKKLTDEELEREKAERRRESLNKWSRGGRLGE